MDKDNVSIDNMDKETKIKMMRKLMLSMLESDVDGTFKEACDVMTNVIDNYESIDKDMVSRLNDIFSNDLVKREKFTDIIKAIGQGSTVVYFKSAQLFKIYKQSELEQLLGGQLRTIYKQLNESFEVVPNASKQKIVMLCDISLETKIERIKTYIVQFMIGEGISQFTDSDIVCYKGKEALEIIINDYYVDSQEEHDKVVQKLLKYITQQEKSSNIERYIGTGTYSEFEGVKMIPMPSEKELIATKYIEPLLTMISNVQKCSGFKNQIIVNLTVNNDNSVNTTTNNMIPNEDNGEMDQFVDYILEEKPDWYTPNKWILISTLYDKFIDVCNSTISKQRFSINSYNHIFSKKCQKVISGKKGRAVLLFDFDILEK
jgi:hypothetical protein